MEFRPGVPGTKDSMVLMPLGTFRTLRRELLQRDDEICDRPIVQVREEDVRLAVL